MPVYDDNDPKLAGYKPLDDYRKKDMDRSSRRIRDMPWGRRKESGMLGPSEMNFGVLDIDDISPAQTAVLHNTGYDTLQIKGMAIVGDFVVTTDCGASLEPGETCQISVQFNPKREGILTGGIYVDTGDAVGTEFIKLRGSGELGEIIDQPNPPNPPNQPNPPIDDNVEASFSPASLSFGDVQVGENSTVRSVVLTNVGTDPMTIASITAPTGFVVTNSPALTVAAGASITISLRFSPTSVGARTGNLVVNHNGTGTKNVGLSGMGIADTVLPVITISDATLEVRDGIPSFNLPSASLSLGSADFGETAEGIFYVTGSSEADLEITTLPSSGSGFTFGYATSAAGPFLAQTSFVIPQSGRMYVRARVSGVPGNYARTITFESLVQSESMTLTAVIQEEVIPEGMKRIRIAGNQFYKAVDELDQGGTLPAEGGVRLASTNYHGAEGTNQTPHGTWLVTYRSILDTIKGMGFNCIRLPFSGSIFTATPPPTAIDFDLNPEFVGLNSLEIFDLIIDYCEEIELYVVLDRHRRTAGDGADGGPIDGSSDMAKWKADWAAMATRYGNKVNVVGADVHNEPHNHTWTEWATWCEEVGNHIHTIAPDWIIFVEGVGNEGSDHYWWGGYLKGVATRPVVLTIPNRVAYSPHEYGQSVGSQTWQKKDGNTPVGWPLNQAAVWNDYWGFIFYENIAPIWIGEMGGHFGLDADTGVLNKPHRVEETEWMSHLVRYLDWDENIDGTVSTGEAALGNGGKQGMSFAWWSFNPLSADTGGLVLADWVTPQAPKLNLIQPLLD